MCPKCGEDKSKVVDTRYYLGEKFRRRKCEVFGCDHTFVTREYTEPDMAYPEGLRKLSGNRWTAARTLGNGRPAKAKANNNELFKVWNK